MTRQRNIWVTGMRGVALALMMTIFGSGIAAAQSEESLEAQLNLTAKQKEKIAELRTSFKEDSAPIKARIKALRADYDKLKAAEASEADQKEALQKIANEEIALTLLLNAFKKDYLAVLTDDQRRKLQELKKNN